MSLRRGLILNIVGLALVVALTGSAVTAISVKETEINSLVNKLCAAGGVCHARVQSLIEGWLLLLSTVALTLIAVGTWTREKFSGVRTTVEDSTCSFGCEYRTMVEIGPGLVATIATVILALTATVAYVVKAREKRQAVRVLVDDIDDAMAKCSFQGRNLKDAILSLAARA